MYSTLFHIFGIPIRSYGLMMVIGFGLGLWRAVRAARQRGVDPERIYDLSLIALLAGVIGARLLYIMIAPDEGGIRQFFAFWNGGLSFHGGVFLGVGAALLYCHRMKLRFLACADLLAPSLAIGYAFTRIGCFLNGCCYGIPTSLPWGVRFVEGGYLTPPSHPTQLYGFAVSMIIFLLLTRLEKMQRAAGFVFVSYLGMYGFYRFLLEFVREPDPHLWLWGLTQAQWLSIAMVVVSAIVVFVKYRTPVKSK